VEGWGEKWLMKKRPDFSESKGVGFFRHPNKKGGCFDGNTPTFSSKGKIAYKSRSF